MEWSLLMDASKDQQEQLHQALEDFRVAMKLRNAMNVRVAKRVTAVLRIGMVSFGVVAVILLLMLYAFTSKMGEMIVALDTMNREFTSMSQDMTTMRTTLSSMERNISHVPEITQATSDIAETVGEMRSEVTSMQGTIGNLDYEVGGITNKVSNMNWQLRTLDPAVQHMGHDVNRMSGPMRLFNIFNPLN